MGSTHERNPSLWVATSQASDDRPLAADARALSNVHPEDARSLGAGAGVIASLDGEKVAAYRDGDGTLLCVSATCTHLGCQVTFNTAERTWDCPCHGSRFDTQGHVIQGPAVEDLASKAS